MIHLIIEGRPPAKNDHKRMRVVYQRGKPVPVVYPTQRAVEFYNAVGVAIREQYPDHVKITWGTWQCSILAAHDRRALADEFDDLGALDCDATVSIVFDALQHADVIDDDARITELVAQKCHDRDEPRVEIWLEPIN